MTKLSKNETGVAALVVTVIVLLILTITTLGIATLSRREQRQSLDRQLSAEAYYAAEAGVNDAIKKINSGADVSTLGKDCNNPEAWSPTGLPDSNKLIQSNSISNALGGISAQSQYTCVLTEDSARSLEYSQVSDDKSVSADFTVTTGIQTLVVGWEHYLGGNTFRNCGLGQPFTNATSWNSGPALKVDVTNLTGANYSRNNLIKNTNSFYLYPCAVSGAYTASSFGTQSFAPTTTIPAASANNSIVSGSCDTGATPSPTSPGQIRRCNVHIIGLGGANHILLRIRPIYDIANISVVGLDAGGTPLALNGGQTIIDVTAKAADVVKRIQVRYSPALPYYLFALDSANSICKRLTAAPGIGGFDPFNVPAADQPICNPLVN